MRAKITNACLSVLVAVAAARPEEAGPKLPVPDPAARREAESLVREAFREEYAGRGPVLSALVKKLLELAKDPGGDPARRYALLEEAAGLAAKEGDLELAFSAVKEEARLFQVDLFSRQHEMLDGFSPRESSGMEALFQSHLRLFDEAFQADRYEVATASAASARKQAEKLRRKDLAALAGEKAKEAEEVGLEFATARGAGEAAKLDPRDGRAALAFGRFLCLSKGEWKRGLEFLAKGQGPLTLQAERDFAQPPSAPQRASVGDGWWELAQAEKGLARKRLWERAVHWYELALPQLAEGERARVEQRLSEIERSRPGGVPRGALLLLTFEPETFFDSEAGTSVRDQSGKGNHGFLRGAKPTRGKAGGALSFDGLDDSVDCGKMADLDAAREFTLSVWVSPSSVTGGALGYILSKDDWKSGSRGFVLRLGKGAAPDFTIGSSTWTSVQGKSLRKGEWRHLAATYGSGTIRLFLDGAVVDSSPSGGEIQPSSFSFSIGRGTYDRGRRFHGAIDELAIFARALSQEEVRWLFQKGRKGQSLR